jgi:hypothetical protein
MRSGANTPIRTKSSAGVSTSQGQFFISSPPRTAQTGIGAHRAEVHEQVDGDKEHDEQHQHRLHADEIAKTDRLDEEGTDAVQSE